MSSPWDSVGAFEGPEKTLTLCFRTSKIPAQSLRFIPRASWETVLKAARCEIISSVESNPATAAIDTGKKKRDKAKTKGITGYLLSESSLFLSDSTLSLKTCGTTTPLEAMEPILDLVVPSWRQKYPDQYLKYVTFGRLGYMFPDEQIGHHISWESEVAHLDKHFQGEAVVNGSRANNTHHMYVANYLPKDEIFDVFSTQVALTELDSEDSLRRFVETHASDKAPLQSAWKEMHGGNSRSVAAKVELDECFFPPVGYSANGVFGKHFTTVHATPQPGCSYVSVETSMPMTKDARQRFVIGAQNMCKADVLSISEFALSSVLFSGGDAPEIPGFDVQQSSRTIGSRFACALHHYRRTSSIPRPPVAAMVSPALTCSSAPLSPSMTMLDDYDIESLEIFPATVIEVNELSEAPVKAASVFLEEEVHRSSKDEQDMPMALLDVGALRRQADTWRRLLPRVQPFYAVKCNTNPAIIETLWQVWKEQGFGGFDCASPSEMEAVINLEGIKMDQHVLYANPCKQVSALSAAKGMGVQWIVFDNAGELEKIKEIHPSAKLLLRVQTDDSLAQCPLSNKFGAAVEGCGALLAYAKKLGLSVAGVSFHVGSGCSQLGAFRSALCRARAVFDEAERQGLVLELLDIGGGFPGWDEEGEATFADHASDIREVLDDLFSHNIRVVAEPGRFFVAVAQASLTTVISAADTEQGFRYYLNDGVYGSFNCLLYDHAKVPQPLILRGGQELSAADMSVVFPCTVFGPTCDGFDVVAESMSLPRLEAGDKLLFPNMGAYTSSASTSFNGFAPASSFVYESRPSASEQ